VESGGIRRVLTIAEEVKGKKPRKKTLERGQKAGGHRTIQKILGGDGLL